MISDAGPGCHACEQEAAGPAAPAYERIWVGEHWRVVHAIRCALPGWLVLVPRRHVEAVADLGADEAAELGRLQVAASQALHETVGCVKTYLVQFAEADGFAHVHVHLVPRAADLPMDHRGPDVFTYLGRPESERVPQAEMDALAARLGPVVASRMTAG